MQIVVILRKILNIALSHYGQWAYYNFPNTFIFDISFCSFTLIFDISNVNRDKTKKLFPCVTLFWTQFMRSLKFRKSVLWKAEHFEYALPREAEWDIWTMQYATLCSRHSILSHYGQWAYYNFPNTYNWYLTTQMSANDKQIFIYLFY